MPVPVSYIDLSVYFTQSLESECNSRYYHKSTIARKHNPHNLKLVTAWLSALSTPEHTQWYCREAWFHSVSMGINPSKGINKRKLHTSYSACTV